MAVAAVAAVAVMVTSAAAVASAAEVEAAAAAAKRGTMAAAAVGGGGGDDGGVEPLHRRARWRAPIKGTQKMQSTPSRDDGGERQCSAADHSAYSASRCRWCACACWLEHRANPIVWKWGRSMSADTPSSAATARMLVPSSSARARFEMPSRFYIVLRTI